MNHKKNISSTTHFSILHLMLTNLQKPDTSQLLQFVYY